MPWAGHILATAVGEGGAGNSPAGAERSPGTAVALGWRLGALLGLLLLPPVPSEGPDPNKDGFEKTKRFLSNGTVTLRVK